MIILLVRELNLGFLLTVICNQPVKKGFCSFTFYRYYFNPESALCESFIFTGCGGNRNNFKMGKGFKSSSSERTDVQ